MLEYATALQLAKNYDESNKAFLQGRRSHRHQRLSFRLAHHGLAACCSEGMVQYKGDDYEKVLINAMLAINYLMQDKLEDAMVETRKLNDKLYKFRFEGKKNYEQNPIRLLSFGFDRGEPKGLG